MRLTFVTYWKNMVYKVSIKESEGDGLPVLMWERGSNSQVSSCDVISSPIRMLSCIQPRQRQTERITHRAGERIWCTYWEFLKTGEPTHCTIQVGDKNQTGLDDSYTHTHMQLQHPSTSHYQTFPALRVSSKPGYVLVRCKGCISCDTRYTDE